MIYTNRILKYMTSINTVQNQVQTVF